jgi:hypothetical protein
MSSLSFKALFAVTILCLHIQIAFASKVIGITCDGTSEALSLSEGRFLDEGKHELISETTFKWSLLESFVSKYVSAQSVEGQILKRNLIKLKNDYLLNEAIKLPEVLESEILIDRSEICQYASLIQFRKGQFHFSKNLYRWQKEGLYSVFLEALFLPLSTKHSPIGMRSLVYSHLTNKYVKNSKIQNLEAYQNAGIPFFTLGETRIDLNRKFHYDQDTGEVFAGYLYKKEMIHFPEGSCIGSTFQPVLFDNYNLEKAMVASDCSIVIGGKKYHLLEESFIQISRTGLFSNEPRDPYIKFIYLKPGQLIQSKNVDFISSSDLHRPSKIVFSTDGDGSQMDFISFLGSVWVGGDKKKIVDYSNSSISRSTGKVSFMVLSEAFEYRFNYGVLSVNGVVMFSSEILLNGEIEDNNSMIILSLGTVKLKQFSQIAFRAIHGGLVWKFTLGEDAILQVSSGDAKKFLEGQVITLDQNGLVTDFN